MMPAIALLGWPVVAFGMFRALGAVHGLIWVTLIGYLFLPEAYKFEFSGLPEYDKFSALSLTLLFALMMPRKDGQGATVIGDQRFHKILVLLTLVILITPVFTVFDNRFSIPTGPRVRQALGLKDIIAMVTETVVLMTPFYLAWRYLTTARHHAALLLAIVALGVIYAFLALFEVRMSPQLNRWIYGYFPHSWVQHLRGGFRPLVFLEHGLWVGFFLLMAILSSFALVRQNVSLIRAGLAGAGLFILGTLFLSRNLGATLLVMMFVPMVLVLSARMQARVAMLVAVLFLSYPYLRHAELVPINSFVSVIQTQSPDRARSFQFRMENENALLERALEQPAFGWGIWARAQLFDEKKGRMISVPDGIWVIVIGERGWVGFLSFFGLLAMPLFFLNRAARRKPLTPATAGLAAIAAANFIYMIPNAVLTPANMLVFGALAGFVHSDLKEKASEEAPEADDTANRGSRYSRFAPGEGRAATAHTRDLKAPE